MIGNPVNAGWVTFHYARWFSSVKGAFSQSLRQSSALLVPCTVVQLGETPDFLDLAKNPSFPN